MSTIALLEPRRRSFVSVVSVATLCFGLRWQVARGIELKQTAQTGSQRAADAGIDAMDDDPNAAPPGMEWVYVGGCPNGATSYRGMTFSCGWGRVLRRIGSDGSVDYVPPHLEPGSPTVSGPLATTVVRRLVEVSSSELGHCYDRSRQDTPLPAGHFIVHFTIGIYGRVTAATATVSDVGMSRIAECVRAGVSTFRFPQPITAAPVSVDYPFTLSPGT